MIDWYKARSVWAWTEKIEVTTANKAKGVNCQCRGNVCGSSLIAKCIAAVESQFNEMQNSYFAT